jgi:SAM-dependent methyltransferase
MEGQVMSVYDRAAASYERVGPPFFSYFGRRIVDMVGVPEASRVLDVACGTGAVLFATAERIGPRGVIVGVDRASAMVDRARSEIRHRGVSNAFVTRMDALTLAFPENVFDAVFCGFALNGLPTPDLALSEFSRVLRPQGRVGLIVSEGWWWEGDDRWQWHRALLDALGIRIDQEPRRFAAPQNLLEMLTDQGFERVSVSTENYALVFADVEEWWNWTWSHGYRQILEQMSASQLERYRAACFEHLQDRPVEGRLQVFLAGGMKPST